MVEEAIGMDKRISNSEEAEVRKGPWTMEEDLTLVNYISNHGEGVWSNIARSAGIYIYIFYSFLVEPDGEKLQAEVAELPAAGREAGQHHAGGGAADHGASREVGKQLPGRTDNEIKNFWRTRVQKRLKHGECLKNNLMLRDEASTSALQVNAAGDVGGGAKPVCNGNIIDGDLQYMDSDDFNFWSVEDFWLLN
ncbi:hypothetical protein ZIOFF_057268 [Zingiber officinale]|uniref:Uncharacterized protein n=1 Tax=Zingiber officinale TaxID=94328 RepID=A0A8J5F333_ZINOF|nr:hypothetical protein ZIOFF_057268 [Zingiber officinale]